MLDIFLMKNTYKCKYTVYNDQILVLDSNFWGRCRYSLLCRHSFGPCIKYMAFLVVEGTVASWLVHLTPERAVQVRALARNIVLCSWARHLTLTVSLSTQVNKWLPANLMLGIITLWWTNIPSRGEWKITPSCFTLLKPRLLSSEEMSHLARMHP